jgi:alkylation response protein AidB-like acyl-CoA dehydrogenase
MDFSIPDEARDAQAAVAQWARQRPGPAADDPLERARFDGATWRDAAVWGITGLAGADQPALLRAVIFAEITRRCGLPGPLLEADIAAWRWPEVATGALEQGRVVTTVAPGVAGPSIVGWGAVADLVIDEASGEVVARAPLPDLARFEYPLPHAWWTRRAGDGHDPALTRKWILGGALLVGLARGALDLTVEHTKVRTQFGRPLAANQAIQFPLVECMVQVEASWFMVADAAAKYDAGDPLAEAGAALAWLNVGRVAAELSAHCHQAFGALGFCFEAGLVDFTWPMKWLSSSVPRAAALSSVQRQRVRRFDSASGGCLVLEGFRVPSDGEGGA